MIYVYPINVFSHNCVKLFIYFLSPVSNKKISVSFLFSKKDLHLYITRYKYLSSCEINIAPAMDISFLQLVAALMSSDQSLQTKLLSNKITADCML